jgi:branched-chain amino acid transport system substrate-binding protein
VPSQWEPQVKYQPDFGPTPEEFAKKYYDKSHVEADYHTASGYVTGLLLQHAIEQAGSIDAKKVAAALDKTDVTTFFGRDKFSTDPKSHGLQVSHEMVLAQWQKKGGKLEKEMVWPDAAKTAALNYPLQQ